MMSPQPFLPVMGPSDTEKLVNNPSVHSFNSETNELTWTRSVGDRRYSKMCLKQSRNNTIDIVITNGQQSNTTDLSPHIIGSRDIRKEYSSCAKFGVVFVVMLLFIMVMIMIIALLTSPKSTTAAGSGDLLHNNSVLLQPNLPSNNATFATENSTTLIQY